MDKTSVNKNIRGTYFNDDLILTFDAGILNGYSECNEINGEYYLNDNYVFINAKQTKVFCENDFNVYYLNIWLVGKLNIRDGCKS